MNRSKIAFVAGFIFISIASTAQQKEYIIQRTQANELRNKAQVFTERQLTNKTEAIRLASENGWIIREEMEDGPTIELQGVTPEGLPIYYITFNEDAASTTSTNQVWTGGSSGLSLDGTGMLVGIWDGGAVRASHQEYAGRVTQKDNNTTPYYHASHVAGTLVASGVQDGAQGMARNAYLDAWDWNVDDGEMANAAADGLLISNHSYGFRTGWDRNIDGEWEFYGDDRFSSYEDYQFGYYSIYSRNWDEIAFDAPYYLVVKAAGNDRNDGPGVASGTNERDGDIYGYDCISYRGVSKNILTVGAVNDLVGGYLGDPSSVTMTSFSGWGPADDGRIKPDICGNGMGLFSSLHRTDDDYASMNGTSMASPNVAGSLLLLQEHYIETQGNPMRAASLKALAIHTADEAGPDEGPDYMFGWGLLNTETAAEVITNIGQSSMIAEHTLTQGNSFNLDINASGNEPLIVTVVWTDPPGTPVAPSLDPTDIMLVNDLDLRITDGVETYYPYRMEGQSPFYYVARGDNDVDNVEKIFIPNPEGGSYTITVYHEGSLTNSEQDFSIIVSGAVASSCGPCLDETLTSSSGDLSDNSCEENYQNNMDCRKLIQPTGAEYITLNFITFDLEANYDFVRVYDGTTSSAPLLGEFTGNTIPPAITSSGGSMLVHFTSDYSITASGWDAEYTSVAPGACIDETFTEQYGDVSDNSGTGNYTNNADCRKLIQPNDATWITLNFSEFNLQNGYDFVRVYDGPSTSDPLLGQYTGNTVPGSITSNGGSMLIQFTSNSSITAPGWIASYYSDAQYCGSCEDRVFTAAPDETSDNSCDENYQNNADCRKLIFNENSDLLTLTFTEFDLESGYDFVRVYNGNSTSDPLLGEFTGSSLPGPITTSGVYTLIHFTSDYSITQGGWSAEFDISPQYGCRNETYTAESGFINDNSGNGNYLNYDDCQKLIQPVDAAEITLTFDEFNLENGNDYVRVYDGPTTSAPLLGEFTGSNLPGPITSSGESMLIHFTSNGSITAPGWSASYTSEIIPCGPCLNETFTTPTGAMQDNSCYDDYGNNTDCRKLIQPEGADNITFYFTWLDVESGYDFVRVYDGTNTSAPLLGEFTGSTIPSAVTSSGGSMLIHFTSDYSITATGWDAEYYITSVDPICTDQTFTASEGVIDDNSGTQNYMNFADCRKLIQPVGADYITLNFTSFDLENGNDYVRVYDGAATSDPLLGVYTGSTLPGEITSSGGSMLIHFMSNGSVTRTGWSANYDSYSDIPCGPCLNETFTAPSGDMADNSCWDDYLNNTDCRKLIQPVGANYITFYFTWLDIESGYDFVRVYDGTTTSAPLLGEFTGNSIPSAVTSSGGSMLIHFTSDHSITATGWDASYEINGPTCGPCVDMTFTESIGVITDNSCEGDYENNADCRKLIQPMGADYITLNFAYLDIEAGYDFLRVYDGSSTSDPLLGEFTGNSTPGSITSSGGTMLVHFTSDYSVTSAGWDAEFISNTHGSIAESNVDDELLLGSPDKAGTENGFTIFPNPTSGKFTISLDNRVDDDLVLRITDTSGKIVAQRMIPSNGNRIHEEIEFTDKPAGIYFIQLYNTSFRQVGKLVVY